MKRLGFYIEYFSIPRIESPCPYLLMISSLPQPCLLLIQEINAIGVVYYNLMCTYLYNTYVHE